MTEIAPRFTNRAGEAGLVGNCYERAEVSQFHVATASRFAMTPSVFLRHRWRPQAGVRGSDVHRPSSPRDGASGAVEEFRKALELRFARQAVGGRCSARRADLLTFVAEVDQLGTSDGLHP